MEIRLMVSKEKNVERLNKLTDDPAFVVSILKTLGYKECPKETIALKIGLVKPKKTEKTENEVSLSHIIDK